jgi:competence protein ComEC
MTGRGEEEWGRWDPGPVKGRGGPASLILETFARTLAQESDRWFLWLPVVFAGGIVTYFALSNEPDGRVAVALLLAAVGLCLGFRNVPTGLAFAGAFLAFASGFAIAKLRTEMVRAPVLAREMRYAGVGGYVEDHELRDNGRTRLTLRVISLRDLRPEQRPYRVRVSMPAENVADIQIGEAVALSATLEPPPEPVEPGGFDFGRRAWFDR